MQFSQGVIDFVSIQTHGSHQGHTSVPSPVDLSLPFSLSESTPSPSPPPPPEGSHRAINTNQISLCYFHQPLSRSCFGPFFLSRFCKFVSIRSLNLINSSGLTPGLLPCLPGRSLTPVLGASNASVGSLPPSACPDCSSRFCSLSCVSARIFSRFSPGFRTGGAKGSFMLGSLERGPVTAARGWIASAGERGRGLSARGFVGAASGGLSRRSG